MAQTTANADAILKEYYIGPVREQLNQRCVLMFASKTGGDPDSSKGETVPFKGLSRDAEGIEFAGREWVMPQHTSRNEGLGAIAENATLPTAGQQGWTDLKDALKHNVGVIRLSRYAMRLSEQKPGVFLRLLEAETKGMSNDLNKDVNRQAFGGVSVDAVNGCLANITADGANTVTVDTIQYLRLNMVVDILDLTTLGTPVATATARTITAVNTSTRVVTYSGGDVAANTTHGVLVRSGSYGTGAGGVSRETNGLFNLIGTTGVIHGVDSSSAANSWWRSVVQAAGGAQFNEDTGQQVVDGIGASGNGEVELILTTRGIRRRYVNGLKSNKRFNDAQSVTLHGGFKAVMFNEFPLVFDDDCQRGTMYFLQPNALAWVYLPGSDGKGDWNWVDDDGAVLSRAVDRTDAFEGYVAADHDLAVTARNQLGKITGLADDTAAQLWS